MYKATRFSQKYAFQYPTVSTLKYQSFKEEPHKYRQTDGRTDTGTSVTQFQKRRNIHHAYLEVLLLFRVQEINYEYHTLSYLR
jgi:hypothetical protein